MPTESEIKARYNERELERIEAYKQTFNTEAGQRVLADLKATFYDEDLLVRGCPYSTHYNLGLRDAVRRILETLDDGETKTR